MSEARLAALEARVRELEDRAAITELIHRYATCVRLRDRAGGIATLLPDAWFELRHIPPDDPAGEGMLMTRLEGAEAMIGGYDSEAGAANQVWPMLHNIMLLIDGDRAQASCVMASAIWPVGHQFVGEYRDELRRTAHGWRFASRTYRLIGEVGGTYAAEARVAYRAVKDGG